MWAEREARTLLEKHNTELERQVAEMRRALIDVMAVH
jgi:hypothetical protein